MCPACIATATQIVTGAASGAAFIVQAIKALRIRNPKLFKPQQEK
jgi:hypothetical protein